MHERFNVKRFIIIITVLLVLVISGLLIKNMLTKEKEPETIKPQATQTPKTYDLSGDFNVDIIKKFHEIDSTKNYLISPYNIEIALNMLREGALEKTKEELDKVLANREINNIPSTNRINIVNGVFIKDVYKKDVKKSFYDIIKNKYQSEIKYDKFTTPDVINDWVKEKTNGMIPKILDGITPNFVMGLASALTIDVNWLKEFDCTNTTKEPFSKRNNETIDVEMMHQTYESGTKYIKNNDYEGVIIPYRNEENTSTELEFIGILPKDIDGFINNLTSDILNNIDNNIKNASNIFHINLSLPRFTYDYEPDSFIKILNKLGINEAFDDSKANFKNMINIKDNVYINEAIHKTHIELSELGTKASAVTYFGVNVKGMIEPQEYEEVDIKFNRPFIYMIREANTKEILFFGSVGEPNKWIGSTCVEE